MRRVVWCIFLSASIFVFKNEGIAQCVTSPALESEVIVNPTLEKLYQDSVFPDASGARTTLENFRPYEFLSHLQKVGLGSLSAARYGYIVDIVSAGTPIEKHVDILAYQRAISQNAPSTVINGAFIKAINVILSDERASFQASSILGTQLSAPLTFKALLSRAASVTPDQPLYRSAVLGVLSAYAQRGLDAPLTATGFSILHRSRLSQDLYTLGYECAQAQLLASTVPNDWLMTPRIKISYDIASMTISSDKGSKTFPYPTNFRFRPQLEYPAAKPFDVRNAQDFGKVYRGKYRTTDFAYGIFNNIVMDIHGFVIVDAALNLIAQYPDRRFILRYSAENWRTRGVNDFPAYFRAEAARSNLSASHVQFELEPALGIEKEGFGYAWSRDKFLHATVPSSGKPVRLRYNLSFPEVGTVQVPIITEGGGIFPIGKFMLLSQALWMPLVDLGLSAQQIMDRYQTEIGRIPVLISSGAKDTFAFPHLDQYMIPLPVSGENPLIVLPDFNQGAQLYRSLSTSALRQIYRERFLVGHRVKRSAASERVDPDNFGFPFYLRERQISESIGTDIARLQTAPSEKQKLLDGEAQFLRKLGFSVVTTPAFPGLGLSNGFVEASNLGTSFTASSFGFRPFEAALAEVLNRAGYSLKLIPAPRGIEDLAGLHCLTSELRLFGGAKLNASGNAQDGAIGNDTSIVLP